jgi:cellulose synthase/poly-beta-1,6-N-acetylglucosamine synthase-like glycosyltransferase
MYFLIMLFAFYGWHKSHKSHKNQSTLVDRPVKVSVIIAARDEDENLKSLLSDLEDQTYPDQLTEWILVDDHSTNKISDLQVIKNGKHQKLTVIGLDQKVQGKKAALIAGVNNSKGELLIFTDADSRLKKEWIHDFVNTYLSEGAGMIIGLVDYYNCSGILKKFFRFDLLSLVVTGSGLAEIGFPVMCNGANLAVREDLYKKNKDNIRLNISSGDDIFMLHSIKKDPMEKIVLLKSVNSTVMTEAPEKIREFLNQRSRWASKSTSYTDNDTLILALIVFFTNLALISGLIKSMISGSYQNIIFLFLFKLLADSLIILSGLSFFGEKKNVIFLPLFSIIYPFYILTAVLGGFFKKNSWKGRPPVI